jgi:phage gpG-like protein
MSGVTIKVEKSAFDRKLDALSRGIGNARPLMKQWGEVAVASIKENFEVGGRPTHWVPHAPSTIQRRIGRRKVLRQQAARNLRSNASPFRITFQKLLVVTGTLSNVSAQPAATSVKIGTNPASRAYAAIQNFGGRAGRGRKVLIPARPFMLLQEEDQQVMQEQLRTYLRKLVNE